MSDSGKAVFLSYASQDAEAAKRICGALRAGSVEVWFDQSELRGGDAWDQKIRKQIKECALFVPIISANTQARLEGYFRLEWKLAEDRSHLMAKGKPFIMPVCIDETKDWDAQVPDAFMVVQWTRLPGGEASTAFCARVKALLMGNPGARTSSSAPPAERAGTTATPTEPSRLRWPAIGIAAAVTIAALAFWQPWRKAEPVGSATTTSAAAAPISEARKLALQAKALLDDDPLLVRESYLAAERLCERAIALDPAESEAWAVLARATAVLYADYQDWSGQRQDKARSAAETALRLAPDSIESGLALAYYDHRMGAGVAAAEARLRILAERSPRERRVLELLARIAFRDGRQADAEQWATRAEALPGGSPIALVERARYFLGADRLREMGEMVDRSLALRPTTIGYYHKLIHLVWDFGELEAARAVLAGLPSSLFQEDNFAVFDYEVALWSRQFDRAATALQRVPRDFLEEFSIFYPKAFLIGEALHFAGRGSAAELQWRSALQAVEQRMRSEPNSARLLLWKSVLLARLGQPDEARRTFATAVELNPGFVRKVDERFGERLGLTGPQRWSHVIEARFRVLVGAHDAAIEACERLLNRTVRRWPVGVNELRFNPVFDPLRTDPRFQTLLRRAEGWLDEIKRGSANTPGSGDKASASKSSPSDKSIAVLPFANMSPDPDNAFFADGVHEDVITNLAKIRDLKVISRTSTLAYRDAAQRNLRKIGEELGVAAVLEGSVRRAGNKVRVSAELIDARTDLHLWAETYDRELTDIFAVQAALAQEIAGALKANLTAGERALITRLPTRNQEAYDLYLRTRAVRDFSGIGSLRERVPRQIALLNQAVALDPDFAAAHALLAEAHGLMYFLPQFDPKPERARLAKAAVDAAVRAGPGLPETRMAVGAYYFRVEQDFARALREFEAAALMQPNDEWVFHWIGYTCLRLGQWAESLNNFEKVVVLNPRGIVGLNFLINAFHTMRRFEQSRDLADRALRFHPEYAAFDH